MTERCTHDERTNPAPNESKYTNKATKRRAKYSICSEHSCLILYSYQTEPTAAGAVCNPNHVLRISVQVHYHRRYRWVLVRVAVSLASSL